MEKLKKVTNLCVHYLIDYTHTPQNTDTDDNANTYTDTNANTYTDTNAKMNNMFREAHYALGAIKDGDWDEEEECLAAERLAAERLAAERLAAERLAAERLAAERLAAERLAAERLEAEAERKRLEAEAERKRLFRLTVKRLAAGGGGAAATAPTVLSAAAGEWKPCPEAKCPKAVRLQAVRRSLMSKMVLPACNNRQQQQQDAESNLKETWQKYQNAQSAFERAKESGITAANLAELGKKVAKCAGDYVEALFFLACLRTKGLDPYVFRSNVQVTDPSGRTLAEFDMVVFRKGVLPNQWQPVATVEVKGSSSFNLSDSSPEGFVGRLEAQTTRHKNLHGLPVIVVLQQIDFTTGKATNQGLYASQHLASLLPSVPCICSSGALRNLLQDMSGETVNRPGA